MSFPWKRFFEHLEKPAFAFEIKRESTKEKEGNLKEANVIKIDSKEKNIDYKSTFKKFCSGCNKNIKNSANFCEYCGKKQ